MSSKPKKRSSKAFEPRVGFEPPKENELSLSFSEFEIEGNPPEPNSFFSESSKVVDEDSRSKSELELAEDSRGLNHAFFEENSEENSVSINEKESSELFKQGNENTDIAIKTKLKTLQQTPESSLSNEIIISKPNTKEKHAEDLKPSEVKPVNKQPENHKKHCCKCCQLF